VEGDSRPSRFYFVHSYYASRRIPASGRRTEYGLGFAAAVARENLFAVQCHPEKSQHAGLQLLAISCAGTGKTARS
jgi:imidazole glycerol-phosphate synthase subunit HisH